ncbi:MAG: hypothetical protein D8M57_18960 [Candidatus Scalindua sp. AMX11]|nr:MAG: hypothetical protein D8M57_18960 [Candidatus Scalindua sp. AMX11]
MHLQHTIGNQAVEQLFYANSKSLKASFGTPVKTGLGYNFRRIHVKAQEKATVQPKLAVNALGDSYEKETDHCTNQVMRMSESQMQHVCVRDGGCFKWSRARSGQEKMPPQ